MNIKIIKILIFVSFIPLFLNFLITKALCDDCILPSGYLYDSTNYTCSEDWISSPSGTAVLDGDFVRIGARGSVRLKPGFYAEEGSKCVIVAGASDTWEGVTDTFSIAVLPDTHYTESTDPDIQQIYHDQTENITTYADDMNTQFVIHLGDMTTDLYSGNDVLPEYQMEIAFEAQEILTLADIPWSPCMGNHDYKDSLWYNYDSELWNYWFGTDLFLDDPDTFWWYGGCEDADRNENSYYYFSVGALKFMVLVLEYCPRLEVIEWAKRVIDKNPEKRVIIVTHGYLRTGYYNGTGVIYHPDLNNDTNNYRINYLWSNLVSMYPNIFMVVCGHSPGDDVRVRKGFYSNNVYEVLIDYQKEDNWGNGWYKLFTFMPAANRIYMLPLNVSGYTTFNAGYWDQYGNWIRYYDQGINWTNPDLIHYYSIGEEITEGEPDSYTTGGHYYIITGLNY